MKRLTFAIPALAGALLVGAAADPKESGGRIQGTWTIATMEIDGESAPPPKLTMVIRGDRASTAFPAGAGAPLVPMTITLDPSRAPKSIDFTYADGPRKGDVVKGIYKLDGETVVICRAIRDEDPRPTEFATNADSGLILSTWKRGRD